MDFLESANFEEILAALFYWNQRAETADCQQRIYPLLSHTNIRVREASIMVLAEQVRARRLPAAPLQGELRDIMVTSTWFTPGFPLKDKLKDLSLAIEEVLRS